MSSSNCAKEVILCRGITECNDPNNEYTKTFQTAGYACKHLPALKFEFCNIPSLRNCLRSPELYSGLILTSRRAVEAIQLAIKADLGLLEKWANLPAYCVGPATAGLARDKLGLQKCCCEDCGNASNLAHYLVERLEKNAKPLLYPCSAIARDTVPQILGNNNVDFERIVVYDTLAIETLEKDLMSIFDGETPRTVVFFSPSCVEYTLDAGRKHPHIISKIRAVAIGPATADALTKAGIDVCAISSKPDPNALLNAIQQAEL